ncbi:MAG TPA: iron-sulfur cluster assembly accessory protein [Gammaproteobacteria bacterium]|jgi:iron-sulfur cluster assembly accessory protein|nr:iron-sulfur cluster assembly accessory protein [Gammaproteobacteria bacterium]
MQVSISAAARDYLRRQFTQHGALGLRLSIKKTGCSGYAYVPALVSEIQEADHVIEIEPGLKIFLDPIWAHLLANIEVDYVEDSASGLKQKRLVFINANEAGRCGCGESFHLAQ